MEKSRAIELLKLAVPIKALVQQEYSDFIEAVNMGMDALKAQLSQECTTSDLISRQAAIDALENSSKPYVWQGADIIRSLPPIQPEPHYDEWCTSCKEYDHERHCCPRWNRVIRTTLQDAQPEPQWIPVGEKLPETEEFVLTSLTGKYRNTTFEHACEIADYADGEWCVYAYPHMSAEKCAELIEAWMPLPEAYKPNNK